MHLLLYIIEPGGVESKRTCCVSLATCLEAKGYIQNSVVNPHRVMVTETQYDPRGHQQGVRPHGLRLSHELEEESNPGWKFSPLLSLQDLDQLRERLWK